LIINRRVIKVQDTDTAIIILAAGHSSRLGRPKQLLEHKGKSLLKHSIDEAIASNADTVIVVLAPDSEVMVNGISDQKLELVINEQWKEGMASSIRSGLGKVEPETARAIIMVCDQPFVSSQILNSLIAASKDTGKRIIACSFADTFGPPALFDRTLFQELMTLTGDAGARKIVEKNADEVETIYFPNGEIDIDIEEDYKKLTGTNDH
jgi:molybdenum cofactor cytidylyltransferase